MCRKGVTTLDQIGVNFWTPTVPLLINKLHTVQDNPISSRLRWNGPTTTLSTLVANETKKLWNDKASGHGLVLCRIFYRFGKNMLRRLYVMYDATYLEQKLGSYSLHTGSWKWCPESCSITYTVKLFVRGELLSLHPANTKMHSSIGLLVCYFVSAIDEYLCELAY